MGEDTFAWRKLLFHEELDVRTFLANWFLYLLYAASYAYYIVTPKTKYEKKIKTQYVQYIQPGATCVTLCINTIIMQ